MIDLFSVKMNGEYDEIGVTPSISDGTFLCSETFGSYKKGYSYSISNNCDIKRIEQATDLKIQSSIYSTIQSVCEWLNNWFIIRRNYSNFYNRAYEDYGGGWHEVPQFPTTGDLCKIRTTDDWNFVSLYSFVFVSYVTVDGETVTANNPRFNPNETYFYYIMHLPQDVELAISKMLYYDAFTRGTVDGIKSENVGNYSYNLEDITIGSLAYPKELIAGIETNYKRLRFIQ